MIDCSFMGFLLVSEFSTASRWSSTADFFGQIPTQSRSTEDNFGSACFQTLTLKCCFKELWHVPLKSQRDRNTVLFKDRFASGTSPKKKLKWAFQSRWGFLWFFFVVGGGFFGWFFVFLKDYMTLMESIGIHHHI